MLRNLLGLLFLLAVVDVPTCSAAKDRNLPHAHRGKLTPYQPGPFESLKLTDEDEQHLAAGKSVMKQTEPKPGELGGGAICVQDIDAPKSAVWGQILDLDIYKGKVPKVNESKNYLVRKNEDGTSTIKTKMVLGVLPGYSVRNFVQLYKDKGLHSPDTNPSSIAHSVVSVLWISILIFTTLVHLIL
jgi:hypothetical protein